jgi:putative peptide zinc metalloprotease protein
LGPSLALGGEPTLTVKPEQQQTQAPSSQDGARPPKLADGIELIGLYEDSGYKDPPYVARRADGQVIQMPTLLYAVAEELDGRRGYDELAERISEKLEKQISADNVQFLVAEKLAPLGVVALPEAAAGQQRVQKLDPMLALKLKTAVVPKGVIRAVTTIFYPLFFPPVMAAVLAAIVAVDIWYFFIHGVAQSAREIAYQPVLLLMVLGLVILATALHEFGHATAARYGGAEPGVMGVGIYIVWPAFFTDVTDAYRLGRGGRLRVDLGGIYFNGVFVLLIAAAYFFTRFEPLLLLIVVQHFQALQQLLPFLRLDGYYILSDLVGVPDLFARIKPTLKSAVPGKETEAAAAQLKPWVRVVTTAWVVALIPVLGLVFGLMIFNIPRMVATAWDSLFVQLDKVTSGDGLTMAVGGIQTVALLLPLAGISYTLTRGSAKVVGGAWNWSEGSVVRRGAMLFTTHALALVAGFVLIPNGDYRPIQPNERGTLQGGLQQFAAIQTGRPGLTEERERELGGAPFVRDGRTDEREQQPTQRGTGTTGTTPTETATTTETEPVPTVTETTPTTVTAPTTTVQATTPTGITTTTP